MKIRLFLFSFFFLMYSLKSEAQDLAIYTQTQIPQASLLNPAYQIKCKKYIAIPLLASLKWNFNNDFSYKDAITKGSNRLKDSVLFNYNAMFSQAKNSNKIQFSAQVVLLDVGFRKKKSFLSFSIRTNYNFSLYFSKDLLLLATGNYDFSNQTHRSFDLSGSTLNLNDYKAFSFGLSRKLNSNLYAGFRISYLNGNSNIISKRTNLQIQTQISPVSAQIQPDYQLNTAGTAQFDANNLKLSNIQWSLLHPASLLSFTGNHGGKIDLGIGYKTEKLQTAASILNIGGIFWTQNAQQNVANKNIQLSGIDLRNYLNGTLNSVNIEQSIKDSLKQVLALQSSQKSYFAMLPLSFMASANYFINKKLSTAIVFYSQYNFTNMEWASTLSANYQITKIFSLQTNASYKNHSINNYGVGIVGKIKKLQIYAFTENITNSIVTVSGFPYILPYSAHSLNLRLGMNILLGCSQKISATDNKTCPAYN